MNFIVAHLRGAYGTAGWYIFELRNNGAYFPTGEMYTALPPALARADELNNPPVVP